MPRSFLLIHLDYILATKQEIGTHPAGGEYSSEKLLPEPSKAAVEEGMKSRAAKKQIHVEEGVGQKDGHGDDEIEETAEEKAELVVRATPAKVTLDVCVDEFRFVLLICARERGGRFGRGWRDGEMEGEKFY